MLVAAFNVPKLLRAGVTGFLGADCIHAAAVRDAIEVGITEGPRIVSGLKVLLTAAGGTAGRVFRTPSRVGDAHVMTDRSEIRAAGRIRFVGDGLDADASWTRA